MQAEPAAPHAISDGLKQELPVQQPGHDCPSHTQLPPAQRWPF
jgi:hypothetical protein